MVCFHIKDQEFKTQTIIHSIILLVLNFGMTVDPTEVLGQIGHLEQEVEKASSEARAEQQDRFENIRKKLSNLRNRGMINWEQRTIVLKNR